MQSPARFDLSGEAAMREARNHLFPFALLCVLHSIWQFFMSVAPPFDHGVTWSASISLDFQKSRVLLAAENELEDTPSVAHELVGVEFLHARPYRIRVVGRIPLLPPQ